MKHDWQSGHDGRDRMCDAADRGSELEVHGIAATILDATSIGIGLVARSNGRTIDETIAGRRGSSCRRRAIRFVIDSFAGISATAR